ncbi:MAG: hypothetical protein VXY92_08050 [Planctomycetota bacterium]|nr:hypothetical protein [Planctomycetota bacterium]
MRLLHRHALLVFTALAAACGGELRPFDARVFAGTWRGPWTDDAGQRGRVALTVTDEGDALQLACDVLGPSLPGTLPATERVAAKIRDGEAVIEDHRSRTFGSVRGVVTADGRLAITCEGVAGPVESLRGLGSWTGQDLIVEVDVTYDGSLRTSHARVELRRGGRD